MDLKIYATLAHIFLIALSVKCTIGIYYIHSKQNTVNKKTDKYLKNNLFCFEIIWNTSVFFLVFKRIPNQSV